jgi:hypothetical protein
VQEEAGGFWADEDFGGCAEFGRVCPGRERLVGSVIRLLQRVGLAWRKCLVTGPDCSTPCVEFCLSYLKEELCAPVAV